MRKRFQASTKGGSPDEWVAVAQRVLRGDFRKPDSSTVESLKIGMRGNPHADCVAALQMLEKPEPRKRK